MVALAGPGEWRGLHPPFGAPGGPGRPARLTTFAKFLAPGKRVRKFWFTESKVFFRVVDQMLKNIFFSAGRPFLGPKIVQNFSNCPMLAPEGATRPTSRQTLVTSQAPNIWSPISDPNNFGLAGPMFSGSRDRDPMLSPRVVTPFSAHQDRDPKKHGFAHLSTGGNFKGFRGAPDFRLPISSSDFRLPIPFSASATQQVPDTKWLASASATRWRR